MKIVCTSYIQTAEFDDPVKWVQRLNIYLGTMTELAKTNDVIRIEQINYAGIHEINGITHHFLDFKKKKLIFPVKLHRYIRQLKPDVVWVDGLHFPCQTTLLRWQLGSKVKIIVQHHAEKPFIGIKKALQRWASRLVDGYFFASAELGMDWVKNGNIKEPEKIYEVMEVSSVFTPVEKQAARQKTKVKGYPVFLWVGRLNENKDPVTVVKAFKQFVHSYPAARLYMIYATNELEEKITEEGCEAIQLVRKIPHDELLYWYSSADFFIAASHYEGSGTALCEAMSCGCVPVVSNIPSFSTMIKKGEAGFLFSAGDVEGLLRAIHAAINCDYESNRKKVLEQFHEKLSFTVIATKVNSILHSLKK